MAADSRAPRASWGPRGIRSWRFAVVGVGLTVIGLGFLAFGVVILYTYAHRRLWSASPESVAFLSVLGVGYTLLGLSASIPALAMLVRLPHALGDGLTERDLTAVLRALRAALVAEVAPGLVGAATVAAEMAWWPGRASTSLAMVTILMLAAIMPTVLYLTFGETVRRLRAERPPAAGRPAA